MSQVADINWEKASAVLRDCISRPEKFLPEDELGGIPGEPPESRKRMVRGELSALAVERVLFPVFKAVLDAKDRDVKDAAGELSAALHGYADDFCISEDHRRLDDREVEWLNALHALDAVLDPSGEADRG